MRRCNRLASIPNSALRTNDVVDEVHRITKSLAAMGKAPRGIPTEAISQLKPRIGTILAVDCPSFVEMGMAFLENGVGGAEGLWHAIDYQLVGRSELLESLSVATMMRLLNVRNSISACLTERVSHQLPSAAFCAEQSQPYSRVTLIETAAHLRRLGCVLPKSWDTIDLANALAVALEGEPREKLPRLSCGAALGATTLVSEQLAQTPAPAIAQASPSLFKGILISSCAVPQLSPSVVDAVCAGFEALSDVLPISALAWAVRFGERYSHALRTDATRLMAAAVETHDSPSVMFEAIGALFGVQVISAAFTDHGVGSTFGCGPMDCTSRELLGMLAMRCSSTLRWGGCNSTDVTALRSSDLLKLLVCVANFGDLDTAVAERVLSRADIFSMTDASRACEFQWKFKVNAPDAFNRSASRLANRADQVPASVLLAGLRIAVTSRGEDGELFCRAALVHLAGEKLESLSSSDLLVAATAARSIGISDDDGVQLALHNRAVAMLSGMGFGAS